MTWTDELMAAGDEGVGLEVQRDVDLGPLTTYRVGGRAEWFVRAANAEALGRLARIVAGADVATLVVGNGSNLLVADSGFAGVAVQLGEGFSEVSVDGTTVVAGGAASLPVVARRSVAAGLRGFEWAVGVPGSIGGAVRMNAGGHGSEMSAVVTEVRVVDLRSGHDGPMPAGECRFAYRSSAIDASHVVVAATLQLGAGGVVAGERELSEIVRWRRQHQPGGQNAGSVFANPAGDSAGRLADLAGCKGLRIGTAEVSTKHANFIQADAGGSAADVVAVMGEVRARVLAHSGIELRAETRLVGFGAAETAAAGATP